MEGLIICFVETEKQLEGIIEWQNRFKKKVLIIAVMPEVDYVCQEKQYNYISIDDILDWEYLNEVGSKNNIIIENFCDLYDAIIDKYLFQNELHDISGLISARGNFHSIKNLYDSFLLRLIPIKKFFETYKPESVLCINDEKCSAAAETDFMSRNVYSLVTKIVPTVALHFKATIIWLECDSGFNCNTVIFNNEECLLNKIIKNLVRKKLFSPKTFVSTIRRYIRLIGKSKFKSFELTKKIRITYNDIFKIKPFQLNKADIFLLTNINHENLVDNVKVLWSEKYKGRVLDYEFVMNCDSFILEKLESIKNDFFNLVWNDIESNEIIKHFFLFEGLDFYNMFKQYLKAYTFNDMGFLFVYSPIIKKRFESFNNRKVVVLSGGMVLINYLFGKMCDLYQIPFVSIHYGSGSGFSKWPNHERYDFADCDYCIVNGDCAKKFYQTPLSEAYWNRKRKRAIPIAVGALWIDRFLNEKVKKNNRANFKKAVMYVTQGIHGDNRYLGYVFTPEIWYYRFQIRLINFLAGYKDIEVLIKFPPINRYPQIINPVVAWLAENNFENVRIMPDSKFEDVYDQADAYLMDGPGTSLQYMAVTEKPILFYADKRIFKFNPEAAELIKKRGFFADDEKLFFQMLEVFLKKTDWSLSEPINSEFAEQFVTHKNDGKSSERLTDFMYNLLVTR